MNHPELTGCLKTELLGPWLKCLVFHLILDCSSMAAADWVQGAAIAMSCQFQPKHVGTFRKVDAGMVIGAGACSTISALFEESSHSCKLSSHAEYLLWLGTSMFHSLSLGLLCLAGEVQYLLSPPPVWPTLQLTEEALSRLFCRPGPCPGRDVADQWPVAQILKTK